MIMMRSHMQLHIRMLDKLPPAFNAFVRFLPPVGHFVIFQVGFPGQALPAFLTLERCLFVGVRLMNTDVLVEV